MNANVGSSKAIKDTFRALLRTTPYDTITVGDISAAAFVSKKTFYKYFENKEAVVHALYRDDFIQPVLDIRSCLEVDKSPTVVPLMLERNYETLYSNRDIYLNLIEHYGWEKFVELRIESSQSMNRDIYARHGVTGRELEYAAYFVAAAGAMVDLRWIRDGFKESPQEMAALYARWILCRFDHLDEQGAKNLS